MKWKPMIACLTILVLCLGLPVHARGAEIEEHLWDSVDTEALEAAAEGQSGLGPDKGVNFASGLSDLAERAGGQAESALHGAIRSGGLMLLIVLFCGMGETLFQSGQTAMTRTADMIGVVAITLIAASDTASMIGLGREAIGQIDVFSKTLIPILSAASVACGAVTGAAARQAATLLFSDVLITLISRVLIPVIYLYLSVTAATAALGNRGIAAIAGLIRKGVKGVMTTILVLFTGYLSITGAAAGTADAVTLKTTRLAISSMVPVVGGILSDATETVLVGAASVRSAIGVFGTLVVLGFCVSPFLYLGAQYLIYKMISVLACVLHQGTISELIEQIGAAFGLVLGMLGSCALLILISLIMTITVAVP